MRNFFYGNYNMLYKSNATQSDQQTTVITAIYNSSSIAREVEHKEISSMFIIPADRRFFSTEKVIASLSD